MINRCLFIIRRKIVNKNQKWDTNKYRPQFTKRIVSEGVVVTGEDSWFSESAFRRLDYSPAEGCEESNARELQKVETRSKTVLFYTIGTKRGLLEK
ncbi:unnamed protein product [Macrosiphum euphorbiae]|uniref:Uncharacterized protein n=1 Tax=Macrosiphum euphorbiae TaxID=13131 RepID=A0AAV0XGL9_9HEMI|nr:unnamed protein product [Macrosiphum euphorbiae]